MTNTGWRITPLGWFVLAVVAGLSIYIIGKCLCRAEGQIVE